MKYQILEGDNRETLKTIPDNSIDAIVTDPPYGIDFLGKAWDANTGALETYQECLRVLKPGGHILAFSAARTYHHLAITLEQAGFEIRDQIMWIYSSGFPKSQDIGKSIERSENKIKNKSLMIPAANTNSVSINTKCSKCDKPHGTITLTKKCEHTDCPVLSKLKPADNEWAGWGTQLKPAHEPIALARKPIKLSIAGNCQQYGVGALNIDATRIPMSDEDIEKDRIWKERYSAGNTGSPTFAEDDINEQRKVLGGKVLEAVTGRFPSNVVGDIPDYQKYFYCPKVSRKERHIEDAVENNHPTVKPIELMKYLIKLITPTGGIVLDPFNGSESTGCAAVELGHTYIGCELDPAYVEITHKRIDAWVKDKDPLSATGLFE